MLEEVIKTLISHPIILSTIGPFLFGGETILILSILAGQGFIPLPIVIIFCPLGMFLADLMWFSLGKIKELSKLKKIKFIHKSYIKAKEEIEQAPNDLFLLVLIKFAYGIGIPILAYLGKKGMSFKEFLTKNSIIIALWSIGIVIIGWITGKTSKIAFTKFGNIYATILLVVTGIIIVHIIARRIRIYIAELEKREKSRK